MPFSLIKTHRHDYELLKKAVSGDEQSAGELINKLSSPAYSLAWKILRDQSDAEEIVQEAFIRLWKNNTYSGKSSLLTYFYSVVRNLCLDRLRLNQRDVFEEYQEDKHGVEDLEKSVDERWLGKEELEIALNQLTPKQRIAVLMWAYEERTAEQIGHFLGVNKNTVDQLLHRAKLKLRKVLDKDGGAGYE